MLVLKIDGPEEVLQGAALAFASNYGWTPEHEQSALDYARDVLKNYMRDGVVGWNVQQATKAAQEAAASGSNGAADLLTTTLEDVKDE